MNDNNQDKDNECNIKNITRTSNEEQNLTTSTPSSDPNLSEILIIQSCKCSHIDFM